WRETYAALEQLATSPEFRQQFGDNYLKGLEERAAFLTQAYEDAGWQGSVCSGQPIPDSGLSFSSATAGGNPSL
ncbi:hypothetical protein ACPTIK_30050, partial [Pseudomonas aeruginosa]